MSALNDLREELKDAGFWLKRAAKHGDLFTDGITTIPLSREIKSGQEHIVRNAIKKAIRYRNDMDANASAKLNRYGGATLGQAAKIERKEDKPSRQRFDPEQRQKIRDRISTMRFDPEQRQKIRDRISTMRFEKNMHPDDIARQLNAEGFTTPDGRSCQPLFVWNQIGHIQKDRDRQRSKELKRKERELAAQLTHSAKPMESPVVEAKTVEQVVEEIQAVAPEPIEVEATPPKPVFDPPQPLGPAMAATPIVQQVTPAAQPAKRVIPDAVSSIMSSTSLDDERKLKMLLWWAEEAQNELGELIIGVLTEPQFKAGLKLKMLKELL